MDDWACLRIHELSFDICNKNYFKTDDENLNDTRVLKLINVLTRFQNANPLKLIQNLTRDHLDFKKSEFQCQSDEEYTEESTEE